MIRVMSRRDRSLPRRVGVDRWSGGLWIMLAALVACLNLVVVEPGRASAGDPPPELEPHLRGIAAHAKPSPMILVPAGEFLMGTNRIDDDPYGLATQYDDTELPQRRIRMDAYEIDRYEVTLGEFLRFLQDHDLPVSLELRRLIWHLITVHYVPDEVMAPWPALYVTWAEASAFCQAQGKALPTEAQWEKAARGTNGNVFPWGSDPPAAALAVYGQYHVHEIPLVAAVDSGEEGRSPFGLHHMAGNVAEWVRDWFLGDYYAIIPFENPPGPREGRYKSVRGGSWKSRPAMLRTATRGGALAEQRAATIGFRCARPVAASDATPPR